MKGIGMGVGGTGGACEDMHPATLMQPCHVA